MVEAPGVALDQQGFEDPARSRAFSVKLLIRATFDVFTDSPAVFSIPFESTQFVEALWRRRESCPVARGGNSAAGVVSSFWSIRRGWKRGATRRNRATAEDFVLADAN
jgi:hypothetical protein